MTITTFFNDKSTYGTFLNHNLITKGKSERLQYCDRISILTNNYYAFKFSYVQLEAKHLVMKKQWKYQCQIPTLVQNGKKTVLKIRKVSF